MALFYIKKHNLTPPLEARGGGTACRDGGDNSTAFLFIPSVAYGDSSPCNKGSLQGALLLTFLY